MAETENTSEEVTPPVKESKNRSKKNPILIISLGCFGLLFLCGMLLALFGTVEIDDECNYKGPLASVDEDSVCHDNYDSRMSSSNLDGGEAIEFEGADYSFEYPGNFTLLETDSAVSVYKTNPAEIIEGDVNPNVTVVRETFFVEEDIDDEICEDFSIKIGNSLATLYEAIDIEKSETTKINGYTVCEVRFSAIVGDLDLIQDLFAFIGNDGENYTVFITTTQGLDSYDVLYNTVSSFEITD